MKRWIARLSLSFFILAAALAWSAYQALQHNAPLWQPTLDITGATASIALAITGTKIRHQR